MRFDPNRPIWLQVMGEIRTDIVTGDKPPGSKMPGGRDLALDYGINPNTAARVYQELEKAGLCETRRGLGTFVTGDSDRIASLRREMAREAAEEFVLRMARLGIGREEAAGMIMKTEEDNDA